MVSQNLELLEARGDLATFLDQLPPHRNDHELIELLVDMNRDGTLAYRWDLRRGPLIRLWYPLNPDLYVHRISAIECDFNAAFAKLFLTGQIAFSPETEPLEIRWFPIMTRPAVQWIM